MAQKQPGPRIAGIAIGAVLLLFGSYLLYEKVGLSLASGQTEERVGTIFRADEPVTFWFSVLSNAFFGAMIVGGGLLALWMTFVPREKR